MAEDASPLPSDEFPGWRFVAPAGKPRIAGYRLQDVATRAGLPWELDRAAAWVWLVYSSHESYRSFVKGVAVAPPRCTLGQNAGGLITVGRGVGPERIHVDLGEAVTRFRQGIDHAAERAVGGAARVGVLLSGGLDSSAVAAATARAWKRIGRTPTDLRAYHLLPRSGPTEVEFARAVADHLGLSLVEFIPPVEDPLLGAMPILANVDTPDAGYGFMTAYGRLFQRMRDDGIDLALTGDGGNELSKAYGYHRDRSGVLRRDSPFAFPLRRVLSRALRLTGAHAVRRRRWSHLPNSFRGRAARTRPLAWAPAPRTGLRGAAARRDQALRSGAQASVAGEFGSDGGAPGLRFSAPLLDARLVDLAVSLEPSVFAAPGVDRGLLREAIRDALPATVVDRTSPGPTVDLQGLVGPYLRTWEHDVMRGGRLVTAGFLPSAGVAEAFRMADCGHPRTLTFVVAMTALELWCRRRGLRL